MTTREENLKKINEELEKLDDEQLEKIAGGGWFGKVKSIEPNPANYQNTPANQVGAVEAVAKLAGL